MITRRQNLTPRSPSAFMSEQPRRIVYVIPTLDQSGAEKQLALLATGLPRDRFAPHVVALTRGGPYQQDIEAAGIPVTVIGKRWKADVGAYFRLKRVLHHLQPDLVHTWLFAANAYTRIALGKQPRCPVVVSERCVDSWKSAWQLRIDRWLAPRTACLIGNSASVIEFYQQHGLPAEQLRVIPNGVAAETGAGMTHVEACEQLGLPPESFLAGYVGRLAPQKRVQDLVWAVETLRQIRPQFHLVVIGDGPERERLESFADAIGCPKNVHFLGHREDAAAWMTGFDAVGLASGFEGMSNSLMEAMGAGKPVVVSDIPANRELVTHEQTGLLVKLGDGVGFMQSFRRLMDEPDLGPRIGAAAQSQMREQFSVGKMIERHIELYDSILSRRH